MKIVLSINGEESEGEYNEIHGKENVELRHIHMFLMNEKKTKTNHKKKRKKKRNECKKLSAMLYTIEGTKYFK